MRTSKVIFWEPCLSPHKTQLLQALVRVLPTVSFVYICEEDLPADRRRLGWSVDSNLPFRVLLRPNSEEIELEAPWSDTTLNVLSGIRHVRAIELAIDCIRRRGGRFCIYSEPRASEGFLGLLRFVQSWVCESWIRKNVSLVFAIGVHGPIWFRSVGYPPERVVRSAYFVDPPTVTTVRGRPDKLQIGYVGRLAREKGIFDVLSAATHYAGQADWHFTGTGPDENELKDAAAQSRNVQIHGPVSLGKIGDVLSALDILVLVSQTKDGWGVIVSEALMCGTAVIVSQKVGSSFLVDNPCFGMRVDSCSATAIADGIACLVDRGQTSEGARAVRQKRAIELLSAEAGASHFAQNIACIESGHLDHLAQL